MPKGYVIFMEDVHDQQGMQDYVQKAIATITAAGGRPIVFDPTPDVREGEWHGPQTVVLEFDSVEAARAWYESAEYQPLVPLRQKAASANCAIVAGLG